MKKVAHILEAGRFGGPNRTIIEICKSLKNDYDFIVVSGCEDSNKFRDELDRIQIKSFFLNLTRLRFNLNEFIKYIFKFPIEIYKIYKIVKDNKIDIIHNHTFLDFKGIIVGRILKIPVVWHLHSSILSSIFKPFFSFFLKLHSGNYICVSKLTRKIFLDPTYHLKTTIIQSPVDTEKFKYYKKNNLIKKEISICTVANFHKDKGQKLLVEAFYLLINDEKAKNFKFTLHLKGKVYKNNIIYVKELKQRILKLKMQNLIFIDDEKKQVNNFLIDKDIFVLASKAEASPISVWEAASTGIPIICTNVGDVKYFIQKYNAGKILFNEDAESLKDLILLLSLNKEHTNYGFNAHKMVENEFCSTRIRNKYKNVYTTLIN